MKRQLLIVSLAVAMGFAAGACREEGAVEKAGRKLDEAVDELTHPNEGQLERLGRKTDETLEKAKEAITGDERE